MYAIIHPITPFDSANGTTISFTWNGNQIYKVRCIIKNNETNETVYDNTISTMKQSYTIPENSGLINGTYYIAYITVFDVDDNESSLQNIGTPFYCFTTPTFALSINPEDIIQSSNYSVTLSYSQTENEPLNSYEIILYSYQQIELQTSGTLYDIADAQFLMTGLENANEYYVRAIGTTLNGMALDTGYIHFIVSYVQASIFSTLELNNLPDIGGIEIKSNIISTVGHAKNEDVIYLNPQGVDLADNEIEYDVGFEIQGDFSQMFQIKDPKINNVIVSMTDEENATSIDIIYREGSYSTSNGRKAYLELQASMSGYVYIAMSNYIDIPTASQDIVFYVNRQGTFFDVHAVLVDSNIIDEDI